MTIFREDPKTREITYLPGLTSFRIGEVKRWFFTTFTEAILKIFPAGSFMVTLTVTFLLPTDGTVICIDLPTLVETAADEFLRVTLLRFFVEVVIAK